MEMKILHAAAIVVAVACVPAKAHQSEAYLPIETPEQWVELGARVHGGFGAFIPVGIKIGIDAAEKLKIPRRQLAVTYYDNSATPCACFADGIALATYTSVGQRNLTIATDKATGDAAAVIIIRPRVGGAGYKYTIPMSSLPILQKMNTDLQPLERFHAVMKADGLFMVEKVD
jgi:formylmethanofuran dehydrogenase subunit E